MYTKEEMMAIVKTQLAYDMSCSSHDFNERQALVVEKKSLEGRRIYDHDDCLMKILCFGGKLVISTKEELVEWCAKEFGNYGGTWFFAYPNLRKIDKKLGELGHEIADAHHYYLPDLQAAEVQPITEVRWYEQQEILQFNGDARFEESFIFDPAHPDVLGVAAVVDGELVGMAGASADSELMWQIGVDVVSGYRGKGIASNLVALLKQEILKRGKVPFYGTIESHIASQNVAIKAGFLAAWAELYSQES